MDDMRLVPAGTFWMGSDNHYPEEMPRRQAEVAAFLIDKTPVTNRAFAEFVASTGYVTLAEQKPDTLLYPNADPSLLVPGSSVFVMPSHSCGTADSRAWWRYIPGANWRHPQGPGSDIDEVLDHPVVHVAYVDTQAYAHWAGKRLPTEVEWECAAWGGSTGSAYAWGDELAPEGTMLANYWQGEFPDENLCLDGFQLTSPVGAYPPNGFGLYDMIGNVWEWTRTDWDSPPDSGRPCCAPKARERDFKTSTADTTGTVQAFPRKVLKGGSHLCAENYCRRYRPAARYPHSSDTSTSHVGFRCARDI